MAFGDFHALSSILKYHDRAREAQIHKELPSLLALQLSQRNHLLILQSECFTKLCARTDFAHWLLIFLFKIGRAPIYKDLVMQND